MKQAIFRTVMTIQSIAALSSAAFAGAWTARQGTYYDKAAFNYYESKETFDSSGKRSDNSKNGKFTTIT